MGNHRSFFDQLKADKVKLYLSMRDICWGCQWLTKPPQSDADWNEWWEHVFAEIYWLNVRNDYQFDFFEIFNEPDNSGQGWGGTEAEYLKFAAVTADAINFLYKKYIPSRKPWILGPAVDYPQVASDSSVPGGKGWINDLLGLKPAAINAISFHSYLTLSELTWGVTYAHGLAANHGNPNMPVWISELGTYDQLGNGAQNGNVPFVIRFITSMIQMSQPGALLTGMNYFIWQDSGDGSGLIDKNGTPRTSYYGLRFANRALNHGKSTFAASTSKTSLTALATRDTKEVYFIITNMDPSQTFKVEASFSALVKFTGNGTLYRYDAKNNDIRSRIAVKGGVVTFTIPPNGAVQVVVPF
ncbi:glycoside hydrolase superfamily [Endogone sp. FLAS-F59071]|nr:glycoside hydrolase superfamily [Endogone sp. FLAS-F59071]|eukprot:RUS14051.1 glycoside hydrolase superfamily [Endogone sp. FLAS-F59071]